MLAGRWPSLFQQRICCQIWFYKVVKQIEDFMNWMKDWMSYIAHTIFLHCQTPPCVAFVWKCFWETRKLPPFLYFCPSPVQALGQISKSSPNPKGLNSTWCVTYCWNLTQWLSSYRNHFFGSKFRDSWLDKRLRLASKRVLWCKF